MHCTPCWISVLTRFMAKCTYSLLLDSRPSIKVSEWSETPIIQPTPTKTYSRELHVNFPRVNASLKGRAGRVMSLSSACTATYRWTGYPGKRIKSITGHRNKTVVRYLASRSSMNRYTGHLPRAPFLSYKFPCVEKPARLRQSWRILA